MSRIGTRLVIAAALLLGGCGESGSIFGFERGGPDEFTVVRNQPLSLPPNATLRPPLDGSGSANRDVVSTEARDNLLTSAPGDPAAATDTAVPRYESPAGQSPGEIALVQRTGAYYGVEAGIRRIVDAESSRLALEKESFVNTLLFWQEPPPPGTALDAAAESRRLRENEALGKPVNSGVAPLIVRKRSGVSSLF